MELNSTTTTTIEFGLPRSIQFILIISVNIPSTICSLILLVHLLRKQSRRRALHNHMIILVLFAILIVELIDMPLYLKYLHTGLISPQSSSLCLFWWYVDIGFYDTIVILLAWTAFERHILIFHSALILTRRRQILFHYLPMIILLVYSLTFYLFVLLIPSCDEKYQFDFTAAWCGYRPCYYSIYSLSLYDTLFNATIPCCLIALFSLLLILRVIYMKYIRFNRTIQWRQCRRLTIQMFSTALFFVLFNLPLLTYYLVQVWGTFDENDNNTVLPYLSFAANFSVLLLPFVLFFSFPRKVWRRYMNCKRRISPR